MRALRECGAVIRMGETLDQARRRLREALALWVDDADTAELDEEVRLPVDVRTSLRKYEVAWSRIEEERAKARASTAEATRMLVGAVRAQLS